MEYLVNPLDFSFGSRLDSSDVFMVSEDHDNDDNAHHNSEDVIAVEHRSPKDEPIHIYWNDFAH